MGEAKKEEQARQELIDLGASTTKTARGTIYTLTIIGQIEGPSGAAGEHQDDKI